MLKNLLRFPDIFNPNEYKGRQRLDILLIFLMMTSLVAESMILLTPCNCVPILPQFSGAQGAQTLGICGLILPGALLLVNRALRDARRQAANLEVILNNIADGVLVLDQQGNILSANPALINMLPEDELREISSKPLQKITRWKHKVFAITTAPVPEGGNVVIFRDQTRCHETEQARDALLATVSHEFRTPLAAVMNYLEMLLMLTKMKRIDSEAFSEHLIRALENSRRLQRLVVNILDQAHIQAGVFELKEQRFNLPNLLETSGQLLEAQLNQKGLSYELSIAPDAPAEISGDPERLRQVLVNLIGNAAKFTNQGGIKVRVFRPTDEKLSIEVADTGPGIPHEQLPDIFEVFRRASNYAQRQQQGAGLGLSITKEIITRMGGEISVSSTLGIGSTFTISLPLNDETQNWVLPVSTWPTKQASSVYKTTEMKKIS